MYWSIFQDFPDSLFFRIILHCHENNLSLVVQTTTPKLYHKPYIIWFIALRFCCHLTSRLLIFSCSSFQFISITAFISITIYVYVSLHYCTSHCINIALKLQCDYIVIYMYIALHAAFTLHCIYIALHYIYIYIALHYLCFSLHSFHSLFMFATVSTCINY